MVDHAFVSAHCLPKRANAIFRAFFLLGFRELLCLFISNNKFGAQNCLSAERGVKMLEILI